jgi:hypothetical protein
MGSVQPIPDYIKFAWGAVLYPNGQIGFGYGWYVDYARTSAAEPK